MELTEAHKREEERIEAYNKAEEDMIKALVVLFSTLTITAINTSFLVDDSFAVFKGQGFLGTGFHTPAASLTPFIDKKFAGFPGHFF